MVALHMVANTNYVSVESFLVDWNKLKHLAFAF